eukprot:855867-Amphidinium_carterae.1
MAHGRAEAPSQITIARNPCGTRCSGKCNVWETFALESSDSMIAACGLPLGCSHAVDLLHNFLIKSLRSAGRQVDVRKYGDDVVLIGSGANFAGNLCYASIVRTESNSPRNATIPRLLMPANMHTANASTCECVEPFVHDNSSRESVGECQTPEDG